MLQGSQNQLKEVWEEADGLDPEDFDPKTFFNLHGKTFTNWQLIIYSVLIYYNNVFICFLLLIQIPMEMAFLMSRNWRHCSPKR